MSQPQPRVPVLLLAFVYPPDNHSGADRPHRWARYLEKLGHTVRVVAAQPEDGVSVHDNVWRVRGELNHPPRKSLFYVVERILQECGLFAHEGITWVPRAVGAAEQAAGAGPAPVLISTSPPISVHMAAMRLKQRHGWKWIADFRDPLLGNPFRNPGLSALSDAFWEKRIFRAANLLIANTDTVAALWRQRYPEHAAKIVTIWNGFDPESGIVPLPLPERGFRSILHLGSIYGNRHPGILLDSIERLIGRGHINPARVRIQLIGPANRRAFPKPNLLDRLISRGVVEYRPELIPRPQANQLVAQADSLLLLDAVTKTCGLQVPAKLFTYIRIGRPLLALTTGGSPVERILSQSGIPHVILTPAHPAEQADAGVIEFLALPTEPVSHSTWFGREFGAPAQAQVLSELLENLR
jgi:hypothetical protein